MLPLSLNSHSNVLSDYFTAIPKNTLQAASQSAIISFVLSSFFRGSITFGLYSAALGCTASTIYALITPIFKSMNASNRPLQWNEEVARGCISYTLTGCLVLALTGSNAVIEDLWVYALRHMIYSAIPIFDPASNVRNLNNTAITPYL